MYSFSSNSPACLIFWELKRKEKKKKNTKEKKRKIKEINIDLAVLPSQVLFVILKESVL